MKPLYYIIARFYQVRAEQAFKAYVRLTEKAEKFFTKLDGGQE